MDGQEFASRAECDYLTLFIELRDGHFLYYVVDNRSRVAIWAGGEVTLDDAKGSALQAAHRLLNRTCMTFVEWLEAEMPEPVRDFRTRLLSDSSS